jgi:hypothetical protein
MARTCTICQHPKRAEIEGAFGEFSMVAIAKTYGRGRMALTRHREQHTKAHAPASVSTPAHPVSEDRVRITPAGRQVATAAQPPVSRSLTPRTIVPTTREPVSKCPDHPTAPPIPYGHGEMRCGMQKYGCRRTWKV